MSRTRFDQMNCGIAQALEQVGDRWMLLLVRDALLGATRFQQFEENLGIAKNVLADRLAKLVHYGVLDKERLDEPGQRYAYRLTRKGRELWVLLTAMRLWSDKWVFGEEQVPLRFRERGSRRWVAGLVAVDAEGAPVDASDLEGVPGPGWPSRWDRDQQPAWATPPFEHQRGRRERRGKGP